MKIEIRHRVYLYGASVLAVDGLAYLLATLRTPHIDPTGIEVFFYMFGGGSLGIIALVLLSLGSGRGRVVLVLLDLIALYLRFSYVSFQVMLH